MGLSERNWHSDSYLNPEGVDDRYIAAWIALEDIQPDCGPFQYIRGSHRWPVLRRAKLFEHLSEDQRTDPRWPTFTQDEVSAACESERIRRGAEIVTYLPRKGDVLLWHAFLVHRGSAPTRDGALRRTLIAHYSGIDHRPDMYFIRDSATDSSMALFPSKVQEGMPPASIGARDQLPIMAARLARSIRGPANPPSTPRMMG